MSASTRKPICPACHGVGSWAATHLDPSEECEVCNGAGRVNKRTARRYKSRDARRKREARSSSWWNVVRSAHDAIEF